ncbi:ABC transporter permease [Aquimarina sp. AD10]|uniref:ABC transporter permease n=1 Tax=Aquimarina aggregata TaxID=1642818 RepID=A0A163C2D9_9FLAO|nr:MULTISPECIES: ABC transporter permease [Aquimarina]AXT60012.1 ABC transporter permease [Aquimarina sp. AD10]KZS41997.1 ABC transporter permease [Aquimarina aggregata]RKM93788.1 FtsX-like permease family protein [Aquimarina sp. AD10]
MFSLLRENIRIAMDSIKGQVLRTILTILIIAIGITALVGILTFLGALEKTITGDFASMGANTFNLQRYEFNTRNNRDREKINPIINYRNVRAFNDKFQYPFSKTSVSFTGTRGAEVKYENEKTDPEASVLGVNENYLENTGTEIDKGRNFTFFDIQNNNHVCLIGSDFTKNLFKNTNPIGKTISIRGVKFKVIGLLESKGATFRNNQDLKVLIPLQLARSIFTLPNINYNISVKVDDKQFLEGAQDEAIVTFRNIRGLSPVEENNFGLERSDDLINRISNITSYLYYAAWIISIITVFGSSIALMNIMLVSVTERTREIGVRKALGAKKHTISGQFFLETVIIGQFGGLIGIILGIAVGSLAASISNFEFTIPWLAIVAAVVTSFLTAVVSGLYPAVKAANQDPIESLRYE